MIPQTTFLCRHASVCFTESVLYHLGKLVQVFSEVGHTHLRIRRIQFFIPRFKPLNQFVKTVEKYPMLNTN